MLSPIKDPMDFIVINQHQARKMNAWLTFHDAGFYFNGGNNKGTACGASVVKSNTHWVCFSVKHLHLLSVILSQNATLTGRVSLGNTNTHWVYFSGKYQHPLTVFTCKANTHWAGVSDKNQHPLSVFLW